MERDDRSVTLDRILRLIQERRGLDFTSYRRATVERRVLGRMRSVFAQSYADYLDLLERDDDEVGHLLERITIKVSAFFRDTEVFALLQTQALPDVARRTPERPLRVWSAGCGNGEEAYSLAMLLHEMGTEEGGPCPVVYATDLDERALAAARLGRYSEEAIASLDPERRAAYCRRECEGSRAWYTVDERLRAMVTFASHDLASGVRPPGAGLLDLVCCRNVFIYFAGDLRERAQALLRDSVAPGGYLCLGTAEWLVPAVQPDFRVASRRHRIFQRTGG